MRFAVLFAATALLGLAAAADGSSRKAVITPEMDSLTATEAAITAEPGHEAGRYRHGATFAVLGGSTALACEADCGRDEICKAWSFVEAYGASNARCELKSGGGKSEENLLATSGVSPRVDETFWGVLPAAEPVPEDVLIGAGPTPAGAVLLGSEPMISYSYTEVTAD